MPATIRSTRVITDLLLEPLRPEHPGHARVRRSRDPRRLPGDSAPVKSVTHGFGPHAVPGGRAATCPR